MTLMKLDVGRGLQAWRCVKFILHTVFWQLGGNCVALHHGHVILLTSLRSESSLVDISATRSFALERAEVGIVVVALDEVGADGFVAMHAARPTPKACMRPWRLTCEMVIWLLSSLCYS